VGGRELLPIYSYEFQTIRTLSGGRTVMTSLKTEVLLREFLYNGVRIPDPGPELTVDQVRDLLTPNYPEIATASVSGPEDTGSVLRYTFSRAIGSKGWAVATAKITPDELIALFAAKATAPAGEAEQLLVRHLKCKESVDLSRIVTEAMDRYAGTNSQPLPAPAELLPPLG
jgi:PRTRC genetic system protein C